MSGLSPIARRVRNLRRTATRMSVSIGVAVLVMATVVPVSTASASSSDVPPPDKTALVLGGTTVPTPDQCYLDAVRNHFIGPTHPGQNITVRRGDDARGVLAHHGARAASSGSLLLDPQSVWGLDGPAWPDEPWWKLSGLFDLTFDQSVQAGVADLEEAMADARQRASGDLRLLAGRGRREPGEAQAGRAVPGGNRGPRHRLRAER